MITLKPQWTHLKTYEFRQADVRQRSVNSDRNVADISWKQLLRSWPFVIYNLKEYEEFRTHFTQANWDILGPCVTRASIWFHCTISLRCASNWCTITSRKVFQTHNGQLTLAMLRNWMYSYSFEIVPVSPYGFGFMHWHRANAVLWNFSMSRKGLHVIVKAWVKRSRYAKPAYWLRRQIA